MSFRDDAAEAESSVYDRPLPKDMARSNGAEMALSNGAIA